MPKSIRSEGLLALGQAISKIREAEGMSQREFAAKIGYRQSFISKIELGLRRIDVVELVVLSRAVGVPAPELLSLVEEATPEGQKI
jgi:transcriptional regulator with XRE-family HTH domain